MEEMIHTAISDNCVHLLLLRNQCFVKVCELLLEER